MRKVVCCYLSLNQNKTQQIIVTTIKPKNINESTGIECDNTQCSKESTGFSSIDTISAK